MKIDDYNNHPMSGGCVSIVAFIGMAILSIALLLSAVV